MYQKQYYIIVFFVVVSHNFIEGKSTKNNYYSKLYGDGYGEKWIYFPDGDGVPHYVSLTSPKIEDIPQSRELDSFIEYKFYTGGDINKYITLDSSAVPTTPIKMEKFKLSTRPIKLVIHGWRSSVESRSVASVKDAYILKGEINVITLDWSYTAGSIFYHWVANQTFDVGLELASFINSLSKRYNITGEQIHLIGHSLGAHIMGIAAQHCDHTIDRITGLDPARPLFEYPSREEIYKLDAGDAQFVDVIHTCGGVLGIETSVGNVDFYPNNGIAPQPGCDTIPKILEACSHGRSVLYFAESILNPRAFLSYQCKSWVDYLENRCQDNIYMGDKVNRNISGVFYLKTKSRPPYGRGKY